MIDYLREDLHDFFNEKTYHRGITYLGQGRVKNVTLDGSFVRAEVKGSRLYTVHIALQPPTHVKETYRFDSICSCPVAHRCKHAVAALLAVLEKRKQDGPEPSTSSPLSPLSPLSSEKGPLVLRDQTQGWLSQLGTSLHNPEGFLPAKKQTRQTILVYVLYLEGEEKLCLKLYRVTLKKNGEYGQNRTLYDVERFTPQRLARHIAYEDVPLLSRLQHSLSSYTFPRDGYEITALSEASFIENLIGTGKFLGIGVNHAKQLDPT